MPETASNLLKLGEGEMEQILQSLQESTLPTPGFWLPDLCAVHFCCVNHSVVYWTLQIHRFCLGGFNKHRLKRTKKKMLNMLTPFHYHYSLNNTGIVLDTLTNQEIISKGYAQVTCKYSVPYKVLKTSAQFSRLLELQKQKAGEVVQ